MTANPVSIPLTPIPMQQTGASHYTNASTGPTGHEERMNEFLQRPATSPPFPNDLPDRPFSKPFNYWVPISIVLFVLLIGTAVPMGVLLGKSLKHTEPQNATVTTTMHHTLTTTDSTTITSVQTFDLTSLVYTTAIVTMAPQASGLDTGPSEPKEEPAAPIATTCAASNANEPLVLARTYCAMVRACEEAKLDKKENECGKDFCKLAKCTERGPTATINVQRVGCCETCGCFDD